MRRWALVVVSCGALTFIWGARLVTSGDDTRARRVQAVRKAVLLDVSSHGLVLVGSLEGSGNAPDRKLLIWDIGLRRYVSEVALAGWSEWPRSAPRTLADIRWNRDVFRFQPDGEHIVALQVPWLVLIDAKRAGEVRRVVPSEDYLRQGGPGPPFPELRSPGVAYLAVNPRDGSVVAAYNVVGQSHVYLYSPGLDALINSWSSPRYIEDVAWSPDGGKLAILSNGRFDSASLRDASQLPAAHRRVETTQEWVTLGKGFRMGVATSDEPDVEIVEPRSFEVLTKFWTGANEAHIQFSGNGALVYVINDSGYYDPSHKGVIKAFSATSGALLRTMTGGPRGVRDSFALSADGRLVAADASTQLPQGLRMEPVAGAKVARVLLLNAETGETLFEYHEKTDGEYWDPLPLAFSPDGRLLFVDFPLSTEEAEEHIEVFSVGSVP